jgi:hypothetical protein
MTDTQDEQAFTDIVDPHQARMGRREALQFASLVIDKEVDDVEDLLDAARQIEAYLDGDDAE